MRETAPPPSGAGTHPTAVRGIFRYREWNIHPDEEPGAELLTFSMECAVCAQYGPGEDTSEDALTWAAKHLTAHPEHLTYRERVTRPYKATPGGWL